MTRIPEAHCVQEDAWRGLAFASTEPWAPHPAAAPTTTRTPDGRFRIAANGAISCIGGWQHVLSGAVPGQACEISMDVEYEGISEPRDTLAATAYWGALAPDQAYFEHSGPVLQWRHLLPVVTGPGRIRFRRVLLAPPGASRLMVRANFRWSQTGSSTWSPPSVCAATWAPRPPVRVCVVTGRYGSRAGLSVNTIADNIRFYLPLCEAACRAASPNLLVLPEIALQWGLTSSHLDSAVQVPGAETRPFQELARANRVRVLLGLHEREESAVYNSAVLISPEGKVDGVYRKVHLAVESEINCGVAPGDSFPVFDTECGRIGVNICMDSSCAESSRMVGLNGGEMLLLPIMGDNRAWFHDQRRFDPDRWNCIMRTRAMDNQLCMVVARNNATGSCIIDHLGRVLAWNDGGLDYIHASVPLDADHLTSINGCYRDVNWVQRRPSLYSAFVDRDNYGSLRAHRNA